MRILGIFDRLRKAEKTRLPVWFRVDEASPNNGDIIVAIDNMDHAVCGSYSNRFIYRIGQTRKAITAYKMWSLVRPYDGNTVWRKFTDPPPNGKIVAISAEFDKCVIADYSQVSMYEFWENYPDGAKTKRV